MKSFFLIITYCFIFIKSVYGKEYVPLVSNLGVDTGIQTGQGLGPLLLSIFNFGLMLAALLAIIYIVLGGVQYMTTDSIFNKEEGKNKITSAVAGLIIVLVGWTILNQINPDILKPKKFTGAPEILGLDITQGGAGKIQDYVFASDFNIQNTSRYSSENNLKIKELIQSNINYPDSELSQYALQKIKESKLPNLQPRDAMEYFGKEKPTAEDWLKLMAAISNKESGFDTNKTYQENFVNSKKENVLSTGLHQLSYESASGYAGRNITTEDLKNPKTNIDISVKILERWIERDGVIYGQKQTNTGTIYQGAGRYWSVMRK